MWNIFSQTDSLPQSNKLLTFKTIVSDTILFHSASSFPDGFKILGISQDTITNSSDEMDLPIDLFEIDYTHSRIIVPSDFHNQYPEIDSLDIRFKPFPIFLTKIYQGYDTSKIFPNVNPDGAVEIEEPVKTLKMIPFEGLDTQGSFIRGITVGNNQDAVLNSTLDLKIEGKLSSKVSLNARINDTNIPIQENGYSQELKDIDRIYVELAGPKWQIFAGDVMLRDSTHYFLNFTKKVQGLSLDINTKNTNVSISAALVKGRFTSYQFQGEEVNQGPYKLQGENGERYIFIINDSERVYINGVLQTRGENRDYTLDYNTGEITFTATNPIDSEMRITVEYQYSDRNYTRFVTHNNVLFKSEKWKSGVTYYQEGDMKNQTLELDLTDEQKEILANSDNNSEVVYVVNAVETPYTTDKILYKKTDNNGMDIFEYSTDADETLYEVSFTYFGSGLGDYKVIEYLASGKIMQYVGENQGDYKAVIPLTAPTSQQLLILNSAYSPSEKMDVNIEMALSNTDQNLFSSIGNNQNKGSAIKANWQQTWMQKKWKATSFVQMDFIHRNFKTPEKIYQVEFDRDWNITSKEGNQSLINSVIKFENKERGSMFYQYENLRFSETYLGNKHSLGADLVYKDLDFSQWNSLLTTNNSSNRTQFVRNETHVGYTFKNWWATADFNWESNKIRKKLDDSYDLNSFKHASEKWMIGLGDTTKIYTKIGLQLTQNDSIRYNQLKQVNNTRNAFLQSQWIHNEKSDLTVYFNYRKAHYLESESINSIHSKINYRQQFLNQLFTFQTEYQNTSGQVARQDYVYQETEPGQGYYTWIDYNGNGLKELDEFEIAQFKDEANYLRVASANSIYLPTQEAKFSQSLIWNPSQWSQKNGLKKWLSRWYNQLNFLVQNNKERIGNSFNINPFYFNNSDVISNQYQLRNQLIFNRGKSHYTTSYIFGQNRQKIWQSYGSVTQDLSFNQISFQHLIEAQWQLGFEYYLSNNKIDNEYYINRNFTINEWQVKPNLTYFFSKTHWLKSTYELAEKQNRINDKEFLQLYKLTLNYLYTSEKGTRFSIDFNLLKNKFDGDANSSVGYQMLEGLQTGNNQLWSVLWSKKLNSFLYLNLNYNGRANEKSRTVHNGNVELRAQF